MNSDCFCYSA